MKEAERTKSLAMGANAPASLLGVECPLQGVKVGKEGELGLLWLSNGEAHR